MNRLGKGFRALGGVFVLLNLIVFFMPVTQSVRENYPTKEWSQLQYVMNVISDGEPYFTEYTMSRVLWVIFLVVLPVIMSALAGIWGIVGDDEQIISPVLSFIILGLYIGLFCSISSYYPNQSYSRAMAGNLNLICSAGGAFFSMIGLFTKPKRKKVVMTEIPHVEEIKQEQIEAKYNIIEEKPAEPVVSHEIPVANPVIHPETPAYVPGNPRGVMVGLTGMYAGAEIAFQDGEKIRLGRTPDNDLIFDEQQVKVSRNHCTVKWDGQNKEYLFWDNSTNGTFANGSDDCLPKHLEVIVKPGTVIALGDENNTFRLE